LSRRGQAARKDIKRLLDVLLLKDLGVEIEAACAQLEILVCAGEK